MNTESRTKPITPDQVVEAKKQSLPLEVIQAFNECIARNWDGRQSIVKQNEATASIKQKLGYDTDNCSPILVIHGGFDNRWLDVEPIYRDAGWTVIYDKPGYSESYEPTFTFSKPKK